MTSKEALERLNNFISREKHINSEHNKIVNECVATIKQDLDKLEKFALENASLQSEIESLHNSLKKVEVLLKHSIDNNAETLNELSKQIKQNNNLKQVIEILKSKGVQESFVKNTKNVNEYNKAIKHLDYFDELTQEEYELLKEYFYEN